ncbi:substrate-binding domain-containing protein [Lentzea sp. BCCO 10_0061]|uniref:Substrate-binding domain-containing protein n=1 Tax=Lentzea sokolovensis TaxID=3095429 RepID=A0ABU4VCX7_9PSEU|nr:substrate-binding domain-containing protein [Lentzea sp. BCCO 10_0061]MDX8149564.1 substrate-binding domain-containing protein [Lentzea sp. BCCO 10_0061]
MRALAAVLLLVLAACTPSTPEVRLKMLASTELADLGPVLTELRKATGVELTVEHRGTVEASRSLAGFDLAWLSTTRFLRLRGAEPELASSVMTSPVVLGVKRGSRAVLGERPTWADVADRAALGQFRYGMADPRVSGGGMAALIGVATAAAGTGAPLRPEDVSCDRLQGFLAGRAFDVPDPVDEFARRSDVDGLVAHESELLSLNASGRLAEPLEIVYPRDGIVLSDYPLMLVEPAHRAAYDRVVEWLRSPDAQRMIAERTWRRPVEPSVVRNEKLRADLGTALYFPNSSEVIDRLLLFHDRAGEGRQVIFVLDYSTSMRGPRLAGLREAFASLNGFDRFYVGETVTIVRFAGTVLEERSITVRGKQDLDALLAVVASDDLRDNTAIWAALDHALRLARGETAVVLMTDGENNAGPSVNEFLRVGRGEVPVFPIRFGEASTAELDRVAQASGGRLVEAGAKSLLEAVREIRGCR